MKKNDLMEECRKKFSDLKIQQRVNLEVGYIDRAYMIGYNEACEKACKWLEDNVYLFDKTTSMYVKHKDAVKLLKQHLHLYSVEQIDNCVKEK